MQKWNYNQEADITLGEQKNYNLLITIISLVSFLVIGSVVTYLYRNELYDYIVNPSIQLTKEEIEVEVGSTLNLDEFLINPHQLEVTYPKQIDTSKVGTQQVEFISNKNTKTLNIKISDKTPPTLTLTQEVIVLTRGEEMSFNIQDKVKEVKDNVSENVKIEYPQNIDFTQKNIDLIYKATDEFGNSTEKTLKLIINDKVEPQIIREEIRVPTPVPVTPSPQPTPTPQPSIPSTPTRVTPYIIGTRNHTVKKGTRPSTLASLLSQGVSGSGYISIDYASVNLTKVGSYNVTYSGSDGARSVITVTVVE